MSRVAFTRLHHLVTLPVTVGARTCRFVFDTGIGLTLLTPEVAAAAGCVADGRTFTGRRMSGQEVTVPLATAGVVSVGDVRREQLDVGILELGAGSPLEEIDGFVSLEFFRHAPFTVDYPASAIVLEPAGSLDERFSSGTAVDLHLEDEGVSLDAFVELTLTNGRSISVEIDMGSDALILDESLAGELGVDLAGDDVRRVQGTDETGHAYTRSFTRLHGAIHPTGAPAARQVDPEVMFQRIVHDGLIGDAFLRAFTVTYDVPRARVLFATPA